MRVPCTYQAVFRVNETYTFESLKSDTCRYFEVHPLDMMLSTDHDEEWGGDRYVRAELERLENTYGRVFLKFLEREEDELGEDPEDLLALLAGEEDPEEAAAPAADVAAGTIAPLAEEAAAPKKAKLNKRQLWMELPAFLTFFLMFVLSLNTRRIVSEQYFMINAVRTALYDENFGDYNEKAFSDIANFEEMFDWLEGVFVPGLFPEETLAGEEVTKTDIGNVAMYNKLVGAIRFRQVRVLPNVGCKLAVMNRRTMVRPNGSLYDEDFVAQCYVRVNELNEQIGSFGPGVLPAWDDGRRRSCADVPGADGTPLEPVGPHGLYDPAQHAPRTLCEAFTYKTMAQTLEVPLEAVGLPANLYPGGGFVRDVVNPINCEEEEGVEPIGMCKRGGQVREDLLLAIEQLKANRWVDANTRAVIIKAAFYNGNTKSFVTAVFILEFTLGGVIVPSAIFGSVATDVYTFSEETMFATVTEFIVYFFMMYNTLRQMRTFYVTFRKEGSVIAYFTDIWNVVELVVLTILYLSITIRMAMLGQFYPPAAIFLPTFTDYSELARQYALSFNLDGLCVVALFFQLFKYLQLSPATNMLWAVLLKAGKDMMYFLLMFFILLLGFGLMGEQMLGTYLDGYSNIMRCMITLFTVLMGDFDVDDFKMANPAFGIMFFIVYILLMFLMLMNIFLAILGEAYSMVRAEADEEAKNQIKTKQRSPKEWLMVVFNLFEAKRASRRAAKDAKEAKEAKAKRASAKPRSANSNNIPR